MPNSYLPSSSSSLEGLIVLGDAMNMRHPLTGGKLPPSSLTSPQSSLYLPIRSHLGGMTVGLKDVALLRKLLSPHTIPDLGSTDMVMAQVQCFHWRRKTYASTINILAESLYALFSASPGKWIVSFSTGFSVDG